MKTRYLIGVDIGTQGEKVVLYDDKGLIKGESFRTSELIHLESGGVEQDPDYILDSVMKGIQKVITESGVSPTDIVAVGLAGQMAGVMGVDEGFRPVGNYDSWLDVRCEKFIDLMKTYGEDEIIRLTGAPVSYYHGPKILWRKHERPEEYERIRKFITITTYVAANLTGMAINDAYIDATHLHFSGFSDIRNMAWSQELLSFFDVEPSKMPQIVDSSRVIGRVTAKASEETSLMEGTVLIAGCGDTAATILGAGGVRPGIAVDIAGTASVLASCVDSYEPDFENKTLLYGKSPIVGLWTPLAYVGGGGQCISWFKKAICMDSVTFQELATEGAEAEPGAGGLLFIPHFAGRTCPNNTRIRGSWLNMNWSHNRGHMYRSILESIAYEYRHYTEIIQRTLPEIKVDAILGVGGGIKSSLFNTIKANTLQAIYKPINRGDVGTLGVAILAGCASGVFQSVAQAVESCISFDSEYNNDPDLALTYQDCYMRYIDMVKKVSDVY